MPRGRAPLRSSVTAIILTALERVAGIEPAPSAWKAEVLPLNYTRKRGVYNPLRSATACGLPTAKPRTSTNTGTSAKPPRSHPIHLVEGVGFEPTKAEPSDLQSDPFGRSGTPPDQANKMDAELCRWRRPMSTQNRAEFSTRRVLPPRRGSTELVPPRGIEPRTFSLQVSCSAVSELWRRGCAY